MRDELLHAVLPLAARAPGVATIQAPSIAYHAIAPILIVLGVACLGVLVEAFVPRDERYAAQMFLAVVGLTASFVVVVLQHKT